MQVGSLGNGGGLPKVASSFFYQLLHCLYGGSYCTLSLPGRVASSQIG